MAKKSSSGSNNNNNNDNNNNSSSGSIDSGKPGKPKSPHASTTTTTAVPERPVVPEARDVLMGRGKRVSEWPGNIHFRQVVGQYRTDYQTTPNHKKVALASLVLDRIHRIGGRFLVQQDPIQQTWITISPEAALEKCCQALREKKWTNPPTQCPFVIHDDDNHNNNNNNYEPDRIPGNSTKKRVSPPPSTITKAKKRKTETAKKPKEEEVPNEQQNILHQKKETEKYTTTKDTDGDESENDNNEEKGDEVMFQVKPVAPQEEEEEEEEQSLDETADESRDASEHENQESSITTTTTSIKPVTLSTCMERTRSLLEDEMISRLHRFVKETGHCAVPSCYSEDDALADWCIAQRQVYREVVVTEYRTATSNERACLELLDKMGFVWDYEEWHWNRLYEILLSYHHHHHHQPLSSCGSSTSIPRDECRKWLLDQRVQMLAGNHAIPVHRKQKLGQLNIVL